MNYWLALDSRDIPAQQTFPPSSKKQKKSKKKPNRLLGSAFHFRTVLAIAHGSLFYLRFSVLLQRPANLL